MLHIEMSDGRKLTPGAESLLMVTRPADAIVPPVKGNGTGSPVNFV